MFKQKDDKMTTDNITYNIIDNVTDKITDNVNNNIDNKKDKNDYEFSWKIFDMLKLNNDIIDNNNSNKYEFKCLSCNSIEYNELNVCTSCGVVHNQYEYIYTSYDNFIENNENTTSQYQYVKYSNSRLSKMNTWYQWSNDEKNKYILQKYIKELCEKLEIYLYIDYICDTVYKVFCVIKQQDGTKRSRVKDGIIIMCIYYIFKVINPSCITDCKPSILAKKIKLNNKYISKAEKVILELLSKNKIKFDKTTLSNKNITCVDYINNTLKEKIKILCKNIPNKIYDNLINLVQLCESQELLIEHTPHSIVISCFYYILILNNFEINLSHFSSIYSLSSITIVKIANKIKQINN